MTLRTGKSFLLLLVAITACGPLAMQMLLPALPAIQKHFAVGGFLVQLTFSLSVLSMAIATLGYGPLSDRLGRLPVLIAGLLLFIAGSVLAAVAPSIEWLIVGRVVQAVGGAAGIVLARSIVRDVYGHEGTARMMSYLVMAMVSVPMVSPILGGGLTDLAGWRSIFVFVGVVGIVTVVFVLLRAPETHDKAARAAAGGGFWTGMIHLMRSRAFLGYALTSAFSMAVFYAFLGAAPYLMVNNLGHAAGEYGFYFAPVSLAFIVGTFLSTRMLDRLGIDRLILLGSYLTLGLTAVSAAVLLMVPLSGLLLFVPMALISIVQGLVIPNCQAGAINVDPRYAGAASGVTGFLQMAMSAAANQLVGSLNDGGIEVMVAVMVASGFLALAALWLFRPTAAPVAASGPGTR